MTIGAGVSTYPWYCVNRTKCAAPVGRVCDLGRTGLRLRRRVERYSSKPLAHIKGDNSCITRSSPIGFQFSLVPSSLRVFQRNQLIIALWPLCNLHEE
jgi:hypothetical protein